MWIGYDCIVETAFPKLVTIKDGVSISIGVMIIGHFREQQGVTIEEDAFIGPGVIILPETVIGRGAVVTAGSVVTQSVPPFTLVQGNPAKPIAKLTKPLKMDMSVREFSRGLRPFT